MTDLIPGSSPHTRGAHDPLAPGSLQGRIIPAYAGSTETQSAGNRPPSDHPRIRGEHARRRAAPAAREGSSPHTRGAPIPLGAPAWAAGIIPAYAGSTRGRPVSAGHPRIIPAYAGSTLQDDGLGMLLRDHPRIRGEHDAVHMLGVSERGSSPHTRGAHVLALLAMSGLGIIPAYAGST